MADERPPDDVIFLSSSPLGCLTGKKKEFTILQQLDTAAEWRGVVRAFRNRGAKVRCSHRALTQAALRAALAEDPVILHLAGHGDNGLFVAEDVGANAGVGRKIPKREFFARGTAKGKKLQLVVLSLCFSETFADVFTGLGVPHVVCLDSAGADKAAAQFYEEFYDHIARNHSVAAAFDAAKRALLAREEANKPAVQGDESDDGSDSSLSAPDPDAPPILDGVLREPAHGAREGNKFHLLPEGADHRAKLMPAQGAFAVTTAAVRRTTVPPRSEMAHWYALVRGPAVRAVLSRTAGGAHHTVVLHGDAGLGKTEVARQVAHYALERALWFPGGVVYVDGRTAAVGVHPALQVAHALHTASPRVAAFAQPPPSWPATNDGLDWLRVALDTVDEPMLLILDNFDAHRVADQELAATLRQVTASSGARERRVRVLITRRSPLPRAAVAAAGDLHTERLEPIADGPDFHHTGFTRYGSTIADMSMPELLARPWGTEKGWTPCEHWMEEIDTYTHWLWTDVIRGNPGILTQVRRFAIQHQLKDVAAFYRAWTKEHAAVPSVRTAHGARHHFGAGAADSPRVGGGHAELRVASGRKRRARRERRRARRGGVQWRVVDERDERAARRRLRVERRGLLARNAALRRRVREVVRLLGEARALVADA